MLHKPCIHNKAVTIGSRRFLLTSDDDYLKNLSENFEPNQICVLFFHRYYVQSFMLSILVQILDVPVYSFGSLVRSVEAFEPSPSTFTFLKSNIENSTLSNINIHNYALGLKNEHTTLTFSADFRAGAFVSNMTSASSGYVVENIIISNGDEVLLDKKVDFIKIDVEGFEKSVIQGLTKTIQNNHPIVVLELNHWCLNAFQRTSIPDFFDFLQETFPILYAIDSNQYADLHDPSDRYEVMYQHIVHFKYPNIIAAFDKKYIDECFCAR